MASNKGPHGTGDDTDFKTIARKDRRRKSRTWMGFFTAVALRVTIWYAIITALFRCPTSPYLCDESSPRICKPYLHAKAAISPHVTPYYEKYASSYVEAVIPYINTFENQVYGPVSRQVEQVYLSYAAPRLAVAFNYAELQWQKNGVPYLNEAQARTRFLYDQQVGPYVDKASKTVDPYVSVVRGAATEQYHKNFVPFYKKSRPYVEKAYIQGQQVMVEYVMPYSRKIGEVSYVFLSTTVWPRLRVVYGENVEPQLARIRERLASYREGKKLESMAESAERYVEPLPSPKIQNLTDSLTRVPSAASAASAAIKSEDVLSSVSVAAESVVSTFSEAAVPESSTSEPPTSEAATLAPQEREKLATELQSWQERFMKTSDKAAEDLNERLSEISKEQIESQVQGVGQNILRDLETTSQSHIVKLKSRINRLVSELPEDASDEQLRKANDEAHEMIRKAGKAIKEKAQHLRSWKLTYIQNVGALIKSATDSTLKVVDSIRDLGLQDIGMRWASMEDVSYQDWSKYHAEKTLDQWKNKIQNVATGHDALSDATREAEEVEATGMGIAEDIAKELSRLKSVAAWKIDAHDSTEDFESKALPPGAKRLLEKVKDTVSSASEYVAKGSPIVDVKSAASSASDSVIEPDATQKAAKDASSVSKVAGSAASEAASSVSSAATAASAYVSKASSDASSKASSVFSSVDLPDASSASSVVSGYAESASSLGGDAASSISSAGSAASQVVQEKADPSAVSEVSSSFASAAKEARSSVSAEINVSAASDISASVQSVVSEASAQVDPPVASQVKSSIKSAVSDASAVVDPPPASKASKSLKQSASSASSIVNSAASQAQSQYASSASSAASSVISDGAKSVKSASSAVSKSASSASAKGQAEAKDGVSSASSIASSASSSARSKASNSISAASASASSGASSASSAAESVIVDADGAAQIPISSASSAVSSWDDSNEFRSAAALNLRSRAHSMASDFVSSARSVASLASIETPGPEASQISQLAVEKAEAYGKRLVAAANEFAKKDPAQLSKMVMGDSVDASSVSETLAAVAAEVTATAA